MITETRKVFALAALIVASGVVTVELTRSTAQAAEPQIQIMTRSEAYAAARVDTAFDLVAALPERPAVMVPMAAKGDLPVPLGCTGIAGDAQAECMDVAYEVEFDAECRGGVT